MALSTNRARHALFRCQCLRRRVAHAGASSSFAPPSSSNVVGVVAILNPNFNQSNMRVSLLRVSLFFVFCSSVGAWWFATQIQMSALGGTSPALCDLIPGLARRQRRICQMHPDIMLAVLDGARKAVSECQSQFATYRWNCTTVEKAGFGRVLLKQGSREAAFVYAISSAGVVFSVAKSCGKGEIVDCSCDPRRHGRGRDAKGDFTWGGCSDNVRYAANFGRMFVDSKDRRSRDGRALMNLHNNRVGRKTVKRSLQSQCKCHGVSGSCATRTCWKSLPQFNAIGESLRTKYQKAVHVNVSPEKGGLITVESRRYDSPISQQQFNRRTLNNADLVFFEHSPDYCLNDARSGSLGTSGRVCNRTSSGPDSCDVMCCGRGYDTKREYRTHKCNCKFVWCCRVDCQVCTTVVDVYSCKTVERS